MSSQVETVSGQISVGLLAKADRLFRNDDDGVWIELLQNARRAGATKVDVTVEQLQPEIASCVVTVQDNGSGIANFQDLLTLGSSGWTAETEAREDPAGMGFFALCRSDVEVQSGDQSVRITPSVFLGKSQATVHQLVESVEGTRIRFTRESTKNLLTAALERTAEFCPLEVRFDGTLLPKHDFLEGSLYRELIDGIEVGFSTAFVWCRSYPDANWNFYGARIREEQLAFTGLLTAGHKATCTIYARFNVLETARVKLQLPDRKGIIEDEFYREFQRKARAAGYRFFQTQSLHALPFKDWKEAQDLGVALPEAAFLLSTWHAEPQDDNEEPMFGTRELQLLPNVSNVTLVDRDLENAHTLEGALECGAIIGGKLYGETPEFEGYSWYSNLPRIVGTTVSLDGTPYCDWAPAGGRPKRIQVEVITSHSDRPDDRHRIEAQIHVDSDASLWNEACFVAVENSPWDSPEMKGPFSVVEFVMRATFCPSDDSEADSWETQKDRYEQAVCRETNAYFRGPKATLLTILRQAIDYEADRIARDLGVREIRFTRPAEHSHGWSVDLVEAQ